MRKCRQRMCMRIAGQTQGFSIGSNNIPSYLCTQHVDTHKFWGHSHTPRHDLCRNPNLGARRSTALTDHALTVDP
jgi:hypothetical protein